MERWVIISTFLLHIRIGRRSQCREKIPSQSQNKLVESRHLWETKSREIQETKCLLWKSQKLLNQLNCTSSNNISEQVIWLKKPRTLIVTLLKGIRIQLLLMTTMKRNQRMKRRHQKMRRNKPQSKRMRNLLKSENQRSTRSTSHLKMERKWAKKTLSHTIQTISWRSK